MLGWSCQARCKEQLSTLPIPKLKDSYKALSKDVSNLKTKITNIEKKLDLHIFNQSLQNKLFQQLLSNDGISSLDDNKKGEKGPLQGEVMSKLLKMLQPNSSSSEGELVSTSISLLETTTTTTIMPPTRRGIKWIWFGFGSQILIWIWLMTQNHIWSIFD